MLLTDEQRKLFASYCQDQSTTCDMMAKQLDSMGNMVMQTLAKRERMMAAAWSLVQEHLEGGEREVISRNV